jgi:tRNA(Arg) A34 adenosine deaminase TadA
MAGSVLPNPWDEALALAWEAFCARTTPIGAVVLDGTGHLVARARCRRADSGPVPGQLSDTRIAHAEVNVLAQLPFGRDYADHELYATVEPCCLCMGAAIQTGVGAVHYAWADAYAGAASCLTVDNPQVRRKALSVHEPPGGTVSWLAGLLVAVHYEIEVYGRAARKKSWGVATRKHHNPCWTYQRSPESPSIAAYMAVLRAHAPGASP